MAYPSTQLDATKNPRTRCSNCQTVFEVPRELLTSSDTRVRCGECLSIFDALAELRAPDDLSKAVSSEDGFARTSSNDHLMSATHLTVETEPLDVTYSDFDLFSEEADLPEIAYFDQTRDTPDFDFDAVEMAGDETFNDTLFAHDVTIDADATRLRSKPPIFIDREGESVETEYGEMAYVDDAQPHEPVIFNYRDNSSGDNAQPEIQSEPPRVQTPSISKRIPKPKKPILKPSLKPSTKVVAEITRAPGAPPLPDEPKPEPIFVEGVDEIPVSEKVRTEARLKRPTIPSRWFFRLGMLALFGVLVSSLLLFRSKPQMYNSPAMRPVLEAGCAVMRCAVPARVDLASLKMVKRNMFSHPNTPNALVVNVSFRNDAEFEQQLPLLHMVLSNRVGRVVARQDFTPPTYIRGWNKSAVIKPGQQLDVTLEVIDPGRDAQSFEFYFRQYKS